MCLPGSFPSSPTKPQPALSSWASLGDLGIISFFFLETCPQGLPFPPREGLLSTSQALILEPPAGCPASGQSHAEKLTPPREDPCLGMGHTCLRNDSDPSGVAFSGGVRDEGTAPEVSGRRRGTCHCLRPPGVGQADGAGSCCAYIPGLQLVPGPLPAPSGPCPLPQSRGPLDASCGEPAGTELSREQVHGKQRSKKSTRAVTALAHAGPGSGSCPGQFPPPARGGRRVGRGPRALHCPLPSGPVERLLLFSPCFGHRGRTRVVMATPAEGRRARAWEPDCILLSAGSPRGDLQRSQAAR